MLLTELPRLGAQTRWVQSMDRPGPSGSALVTWVTLQGFLFLLTAEGAESQQDANLSAWGEIGLHGQDRTLQAKPSNWATSEHLTRIQLFQECSRDEDTWNWLKAGKMANNCPLLELMLLFLHLRKGPEDSQEHGKQRFPRDNLNSWSFSGFC